LKGDPTEYNIPNTFAPRCRTNVFSVNQIIHGLRFGFFQLDKLPNDVRTIHDKIRSII